MHNAFDDPQVPSGFSVSRAGSLCLDHSELLQCQSMDSGIQVGQPDLGLVAVVDVPLKIGSRLGPVFVAEDDGVTVESQVLASLAVNLVTHDDVGVVTKLALAPPAHGSQAQPEISGRPALVDREATTNLPSYGSSYINVSEHELLLVGSDDWSS